MILMIWRMRLSRKGNQREQCGSLCKCKIDPERAKGKGKDLIHLSHLEEHMKSLMGKRFR